MPAKPRAKSASASITDASDDAVPTGWAGAPLMTLVEINPPRPRENLPSPQSLVTFVPMAAVDERTGTIADAQARPLSSVRNGYSAFRSGDVILAKITPCMENGKSAIARDLVNGLGFGSTEFHVLRSRGAVLPEYLYRFVRQESFRRVAESEMTGTVGQKRVPREFLEEVEVPLPPLAEQGRIVAQLDKLLSKLGRGRDRLERLPELLERFRQAVLASAVSGTLTNGWRTLNTPAEAGSDLVRRIAAERSGRKNSRRTRGASASFSLDHLDDLPDLPEFPEGWGVATVGFSAALMQYGTSAKSDAAPEGGVPVLRMGNIQRGRLELLDLKFLDPAKEKLQGFLLEAGDLLFNRTNSPELVGKSAVFGERRACVFASYLIRVRCDTSLLLSDFLVAWINSPWGRAWARQVRTDGVSQSNINSTKLAAMPVPIPSLDEQREVIQRLRALDRLATSIEDAVGSALVRSRRLGEAILAKAFRGELVLTEADLAGREHRAYETAADLLERVQAELAALSAYR